MIEHPVYGTLDEYLALVKKRVENAQPVLSVGVTLTWYADQYQKAKTSAPEPQPPAEPGGARLTLQLIDELRSLPPEQLKVKLEELATIASR